MTIIFKKLFPFFLFSLLGNGLQAQYCAPTMNCMGEHISSVYLLEVTSLSAVINNPSGCNGYIDYSTTVLIPDLQVVVPYLAEIPHTNNTIGVGTDVRAVVVWIDEDHSGTFDNIEARFHLSTALLAAEIPITIPVTALPGITRMRIRYDVNTPLLGPWDDDFACSNGDGEVEDYLVNIINPLSTMPGCAQNPVPNDLAFDVCNTGSALSFEAPDAGTLPLFDPTGYLISLWTDNGSINYLVQDSDIADVLSFSPSFDLTSGETYYWQVKPYNAVDTNKTCDVWSFTTSTKPNPTPDISVDGIFADSATVCAELSVQFNLIDVLGTDLTGATYDWDGTEPTATPLNDTLIPDPTFLLGTPDVTYTLTVNVTDDLGCIGKDSVKITTKPRATAGSIDVVASKVCENESAELTLNGFLGDVEWKYANAATPTNYLATGDFDSTHITMPILQNTFYTAIVDLNGCADSVTTLIEKKDLPFTPGVNFQDTVFCEGDSLFLQAIWPGPGDYLWNNDSASTTETIWVKESGVYNVTGIGLNECKAVSEDITVLKIDKPNAPIINEISGTPCVGDSIVVDVTSNDVVQWFSNGLLISNSDSTYTIFNSVDLAVIGINAIAGCISDSAYYSNNFETAPNKPTVTQINNSDYVVSGGAMTYSWYKDTTLVFVGSDTNFTALEDGDYYVIASNGLCESEPSDVFQVNLATNIGENVLLIDLINLYPNPNNGSFYVELSQEVDLKIYDLNGRHIMAKQLLKGKNIIELSINPGTYIVEYSSVGSPRVFDRLIVY